MYSFSYLEPVCCSMSSSNCCFLTCIQISQEAGKVVRYSHLLQNFPQFVVIHTVKRLWHSQWSTVDVFLELSSFFDDPLDVDNLISGSSIFSRSSLDMWKFIAHVLLKPGLENFEHYFTCMSEKAMATHSCTLVWWRSLVGCCPWVANSWTRLSDFTFTFHFHALEKEMATHCSVLAWRIPGAAEPGGLPSLGSHRVGHDWSDLAAAAY